ncbi:unnamed protein product [Triticum turgidum subsp. durum]|uniref:Uncharacterized protein n=1 Tax=Triticum turgidum subsp. durum TaxID=4567 RepID=A0A9R1R3D3_TRITD|nr:unnamed protein product [Triticum turgidum subsp. durum]
MTGSGAVPGAVADAAVPTGECYFCDRSPAVVYCRADAAGLCLPCDRHVHGANTVSCRHARAPLCAVCRGAAATVRRGAARFLCSNCDFEEQQHREGEVVQPPLLHDRGAVEGYTGCPSVGELAAILGVVVGDKAAEAWWPVWEQPQVLSFDDVIVPTTACHGLQPFLTSSSSPKNRSLPCGELDGEVLRQLGELAKSEEAATEPAGVDQLPPPWGSSDYAAIGHGDIGALGAEAICAAAILHVPPSQEKLSVYSSHVKNQEAWIATSCNELPEQVSASSSAEPSLSSLVEVSEVCPGLSRSGSSSVDDMANGGHDHLSPAAAPVAAAPVQAAPGTKNVGGYDVVYPDRGKVISRYKEKRKNRMFGKQIRYESRKARADGRVRTNGRFAKSSQ